MCSQVLALVRAMSDSDTVHPVCVSIFHHPQAPPGLQLYFLFDSRALTPVAFNRQLGQPPVDDPTQIKIAMNYVTLVAPSPFWSKR